MATQTPPAVGGPTRPTSRRMDSYSPAESAAFAGKERDFLAGHPSTPDPVIEVLSTLGKFKIDSNPADVQYVVFSFNNATRETFEVPGTLARACPDLVRNSQEVFDTGFDQRLEAVPTDEVVAVKLSYDPKTGREL